MPHMEGIFINGEKAKFHPEDILDTDASQYTEEIGESVTAYLTEHITNPSNPPIDTSLSIAGAAADAKKTGDKLTQLKSDLSDRNASIKFVRNLVFSVVSGYFVSKNTQGQTVEVSENSNYGYAIIEVSEGDVISINSANYNNNFSVVTDSTGLILGKLSAYQGNNATVYTMPSTAAKVYLCATQLSSSGTKDVVVLPVDTVITDLTVYNISNYPYGEVKKVIIDKLYDEYNDGFVSDLLDGLQNDIPLPPYINTYDYQYLDNTKWESGYYWFSSNNQVKKTAGSGYVYPPFSVPAGTYLFTNLSGNFSFVQLADGTIKNFGSIQQSTGSIGAFLTLDQSATIYAYNGNVTKSLFMHGALLINDAANDVIYKHGKYNQTVKQIFYCGKTRDYTTLRSAIDAATKYMDSVVFVDAEIFDLTQEFADELPLIDGTNEKEGLILKNRVKLIFASGAKVVFNYTGDNEYVKTCFSPFNSGRHGFTLVNAWVESTNCRYSVHDEMNADSVPYHNVYQRCTFIHDSSATTWGSHQAIGGGLGRFGDILIEDCYASSVGANAANRPVISYHNAGGNKESRNLVIVRNTYIADGTFRCTNNGTTTTKSKAMVSGCCVYGTAPYCETTITAERADNMEIFQWNNEVRNE